MSKRFQKYILFYLSWTVVFSIIIILNIPPEKLTLKIIFIAVIISSILCIPAMCYFFKTLNRAKSKSSNLHLNLASDEQIMLKSNASLRKGVILLGGVLYLTNKHVLFIGTEFFDRNKKLMVAPLELIDYCELDDDYQLRVRIESGKEYTIIAEGAFIFFTELKRILK